jgi:hypothetical protein
MIHIKSTRRSRNRSRRLRKMKTQNTRRLHRRSYKLRRNKRTYKLRRNKRTYKLHGGQLPTRGAGYLPFDPLPAPVLPSIQEPLPLNIGTVNAQIMAQNSKQLFANMQMAGGGKRQQHGKHGKHGKHSKRQQHGGTTTTCGGSITSGMDGYGYIAPTNCTMVPSVNDSMVQPAVIDATSTLVRTITNAVGDLMPTK